MISWIRMAECIFKANLLSYMAHCAGLSVEPIMGVRADGHMMVALEQKHIVAGWEL